MDGYASGYHCRLFQFAGNRLAAQGLQSDRLSDAEVYRMMEKYLQGKWLVGGREWPNVDCYGLVLEVRRDMGLPAWPEWGHARRDDGSMHEVGTAFARELEPFGPEPGAIVAGDTGTMCSGVGGGVDDNGSLVALDSNDSAGVTLRTPRRRQ